MDREEVLRQFVLTRMRIKIFEQKALKRLMEIRSGAYAGNKGEEEMLEKNLSIEKETRLSVHGSMVSFAEYESDSDGDFVKVYTDDHDLGVEAEYAWFRAKYANSVRTLQRSTKMCLNGKVVDCDILTIQTENGETVTVYFDISRLIEGDFWAKRAREEEGNKRKYNKACGEWAKEYGFEFMNTHMNAIFRRRSDDKDMLYTIERWSKMAVAIVLVISSRRLGLWLKEHDSCSGRSHFSTEHGYGIIYKSIIRYDSDYGFHPENVEEYLDEIKPECFPVLERYKDKNTIIEHIKNNGPDYDLWPWSLDYMLCSAEKNDLEFFLINHFKTSDKSKIKDGIIAEISGERHNSYWITELTEKGVL